MTWTLSPPHSSRRMNPLSANSIIGRVNSKRSQGSVTGPVARTTRRPLMPDSQCRTSAPDNESWLAASRSDSICRRKFMSAMSSEPCEQRSRWTEASKVED